MPPAIRRRLTPATLALAPALCVACATEVAPVTQVPVREETQPYEPAPPVPAPSAEAAFAPPGYRAEVVVSGLTYPTSVVFDDAGAMYVADAGWVYGDSSAPTRILRVEPGGAVTTHAAEGLIGPITDLLWWNGALFVSHRGKVSRVDADGRVEDLVTGLPSEGDHFNNQLAAGPDGLLYVAQGTRTNSGVVGVDNFIMGWLKLHPDLHDVPAQPLRLREQVYVSLNPLRLGSPEAELVAQTPAFQPFDEEDAVEVVPGQTKANGTILRFDPARPEESLEVYAWGLRNPFGLVWTPDGRLLAAENGFDNRGSRPIENAPDNLWEIEEGGWYGWPDFASGLPVTDPRFKPEGKEQPELLMEEHPELAGGPLLTLPEHAGVCKLEVVPPGAAFDEPGVLFLAAFGDLAPMTAPVEGRPRPGAAVYRINRARDEAEVFFRARRPDADEAPERDAVTAGPRRPIDVLLAPEGDALYVVDLGHFSVTNTPAPVILPREGTGVIWRIVPDDAAAERRPPANLSLEASLKRGSSR